MKIDLAFCLTDKTYSNIFSFTTHPAFALVCEKLNNWYSRFPNFLEETIYRELNLLFLLSSKKFLDHRSASHLFRLVILMHQLQKKILRFLIFSPELRHVEIRWISTNLQFPFSDKSVLGLLVGFNWIDRYEIFDEENVTLALKKYLPNLQLVKDSSYCQSSLNCNNTKIWYFEIEKKNGEEILSQEKKLLKNVLEEKVKNSIQTVSPTTFMEVKDEEIYKNLLILSQEIQNLKDLPQAYINLDRLTGKEIIFRICLVHISPFHHFSLKEHFFDCKYVSERVTTIRFLENHPIQAHIFRLHLNREASLLRSNGSLDFYLARQKIATLLTNAVGEFRDYNGGILIKHQEHLESFKESFPEFVLRDAEFLETFFYGIIPLEKQVVLPLNILNLLFSYYLQNYDEKLLDNSNYSFNIHRHESNIYLILCGNDVSLVETIRVVLQDKSFTRLEYAYNIIEKRGYVSFNCVLSNTDEEAELFIHDLQDALQIWHKKVKSQQVLRIGLDYVPVSLDPRIGGESLSGDILKTLFEGLTRFNKKGKIENAIAETIEVLPSSKQFTFKLRNTLWNDGTPVTAYDFEYAWKKILSPDFKTAFSYLFYPIVNAKEAKEGKVGSNQIGIQAVDSHTLKVNLLRPTPNFLHLVALPLFSPVHRLVDQSYPQWPYQSEKNYVCNGPFQLKINQPNQGYQLVKNPYYWDTESIILDKITLTVMNSSKSIQSFYKKEIDWVGNPFGGWDSAYSPGDDGSIISYPDSWVCWCIFNTSYAPFNNRKLRQAFAYAIQRAQIIANAFIALKPAFSPLLPNYFESGHPLFPDFDTEKARTLLEEALDELQISKKDLLPLSLVFHEKGIQKYTAPLLAQQFKDCFEIQCELIPLPWNTFFSKMSKGVYQIGLSHWISSVDDPIYTLNAFNCSKEQANFIRWENSEYQNLLNLAEQERNPYQRSSLLLKAEEVLTFETPIVPLFYQPRQALIRKNLHVIYQSSCGSFDIARSYYKTGDQR